MRSVRLGLVVALVGAGIASPALAKGGIVDEIRLGVLWHDVGVFGTSKERGADLNAELRFVSPAFLEPLLSPRPHLGVSVNTDGDTDQAYAGLTWTFTLFRQLLNPVDSLFLDASLGGAVHDGKLSTRDPHRKNLGSRFLFRESLEIGYRFTPAQSVSVILDHISNADLASRNEGLDNLGLRYGLKF
jgi:lipid A 3-O-deacylase